jgi:hypothetical protein
MENKMFTVYGPAGFAFVAQDLDSLKIKLSEYGGMHILGDTYFILQDGKAHEIWVRINYESFRNTYRKLRGYQGWFALSRRKWDSAIGQYTEEIERLPVARFVGSVGHVHAGFEGNLSKEIEVDSIHYRIEYAEALNANVFEVGDILKWIGKYKSHQDSCGVYYRPFVVPTTNDRRYFYHEDNENRYNLAKTKYAESQKGIIRLMRKLIAGDSQ